MKKLCLVVSTMVLTSLNSQDGSVPVKKEVASNATPEAAPEKEEEGDILIMEDDDENEDEEQ